MAYDPAPVREHPMGCRMRPLSSRGMSAVDRVLERRKAAALARHYRDEEGLSIAEIARRLGRAPATVKAYLYDPTRREGEGGQGALRRCVPRLRRLHPAAQRQGRRLRTLQALSSRRDRASVDAGVGAVGNA